MIKIDYEFIAKTPLHTGSDENMGIAKMLRRQKIQIPVVKYKSVYLTQEARHEAIVELLYLVHKAINWQGMDKNRLMGIWDEIYSKLIKACYVSNKYQFLEKFCKSLDVRSIGDNAIDILDTFSDYELLDTIRQEAQIILLKLRRHIKTKEVMQSIYNATLYNKTFEMIPCISGNSIRGALRRLCMYDFVKLVGIRKLKKEIYHTLFTGGALSEGAKFEDIAKREELIAMCPMLALFGAAIGKGTIEGLLSVGMAYPICSELGTGENSYWESLDTIFQTRLDSSKTETEIEIIGEIDEPTQMKYEYEVFVPGTRFKHSFRLIELGELYEAVFNRMINLFKENPFICGMFAVGNSEIDLSQLQDRNDKFYLEYMMANKDKIYGYWQ